MPQTSENPLDHLFEAELETRLHIAVAINSGDTECVRYLLDNRERLIPKLISKALADDADICDTVNTFCRAVHQRHLDGKPLS